VGSLPVADLLPFLVVGIGLPTAVVPAVHGSQGLRKGRMAAGHIESLLTRAPLPEPRTPRRPDGYRVEFDDVTFSYDGVADAVRGITAVCPPGTVTALVGPSGAGKSTLATLLPRFYDVTGGAIRIGGVDVREIDSATLLSSMALVFQDVVLVRDTVAENIRLGRQDATDEEVRRAAKAAQIHHVIEELTDGYDTVLDSAGGGLSGGERQRLTIARAILADAPIIVLDEATASLDPDNEAAVQNALAELADGPTVLVIAHRLHTISGADQILVLDGGRLAETGTHPDLLARDGLYARMWRAQEEGVRA
jgi:ATP-binding cassette, subfamily B, bacterial IrtA/YbtP